MREAGRIARGAGLIGGLFAIAVIVIALESAPGETVGQTMAQRVSSLGLLSALSASVVGVMFLGFLAGGRHRGVVALALCLVTLEGIWTFGRLGAHTNYPPEWGLERKALVDMAAENPNPRISDQIAGLIRLGSELGDVELVVPEEGVAARVRAFTDLQVEVSETPDAPLTLGDEPMVDLGSFGDSDLLLIDGSDDVYVWIAQEDGVILIVPEQLLPIEG